MELGEKIRRMRNQKGLTQEELADRCELTKGYISQLENDLTSPSIATLIDILYALGTDLKEFFSDIENDLFDLCFFDYEFDIFAFAKLDKRSVVHACAHIDCDADNRKLFRIKCGKFC